MPDTGPERWCRNIIKDCYAAVGVNFIILVAVWYFFSPNIPPADYSPVDYWQRHIVLPTAGMLAVNLVTDRLVRSRRLPLTAKEYTSLLLILIFCVFLCCVQSVLAVLLVTFVIPVFISTIFADLTMTRRIFLLSLAAQILSGVKMRFFSTRHFGVWIWIELIVATGILLVSYGMAQILIWNGQSHLTSLARSYSERRSLKEQLQRDDFTGLYNRKAFEHYVRQIQAECRASGDVLSFAMLDVDDFKKINDTFGHVAGDTVLLLLAGILQNHAREDILAFRLGGEEFGLLLAGYSLHEARRVCESMRSRLESARIPEIRSQTVTFSCGIACTEGLDTDAIDLYKAADRMLYRAKSAGKNRIELFDDPAGKTE